MVEGFQFWVEGAAVALACSVLDIPSTVMEKSGRYPGSRSLQLAYSAAGGVGTLVLFLLVGASIYAAFTLGLAHALGLLIAVVVTNRLLITVVSAIAVVQKAAVFVLPFLPVFVVVGAALLFISGREFIGNFGWA